MTNPTFEFGSAQDLLSRLTHPSGKPVVFLVGAGLTSPRGIARPGIPGVAGIIELIRGQLAEDTEGFALLDRLPAGAPETYQKAFLILRQRRGQDEVNRVVREAVWHARSAGTPPPKEIVEGVLAACESAEKDLYGWLLTPGLEALGKIVTAQPDRFGRLVLTTNFDPLVEVSILRAGGRCYRTVLQADGSLSETSAEGCRVVHLHGFWHGSDTLHSPAQLQQSRPRLQAALQRLLRDSILVVLGYGGWDDAFSAALAGVVRDSDASPDVLWAFYGEDANAIRRDHKELLDHLQEGIGRGRVILFQGIDLHELLPRLAEGLELVQVPPVGEMRKQYLTRLQVEYNVVRMVGIEAETTHSPMARVELDRVYVSLDPLSSPQGGAKESRETQAAGDEGPAREPSMFHEVGSAEQGRFVILGLPGSGKSCFLRYLALQLARCCEDGHDVNFRLPGWAAPVLIPIYVPLAYLAQGLKPGESGRKRLIEEFLHRDIGERMQCKGFPAALLRELDILGGIVLFDGLDEVAYGARSGVREAIEDFAASYSRCRILVTCRIFSYTDPNLQFAGWPEIKLAPLDEKKIKSFIQKWYQERQRLDPASAALYEAKRQALERALISGDSRQLNQIADSPLLLTVMAVVHTQRELPDARARVYAECIDLLLLRWHALRTPERTDVLPSLLDALQVPSATVHRALQELAYKALRESNDTPEEAAGAILEDGLTAILYAHFQDPDKIKTFLSYCESSNGLLLLQGKSPRPDALPGDPLLKSYTFIHRTFQEYMAGLHLRRMRNLGQTLREHLARDHRRWRDVILLLAEHLCFSDGDAERAEGVIGKLVPWEDRGHPREIYWRSLWLAGEILTMLRRMVLGTGRDEELDSRIVDGLANLVGQGMLNPNERAAAARTLSVLGDSRPGVGTIAETGGKEPLPEICWAHIPSGILEMGVALERAGEQDAKGSDKAYPDEVGPDNRPFPVQIRELDLSIYPVTLAQYRCFANSDGYKNEVYWTSAGWSWWQWRNKLKTPHLWEKDGEQRSNQPVSPVNWYEAVAFCRWITERFREQGWLSEDEVIRLPTEAEWEWAARGPEGLWYPWGNEWRSDACNSYDARIDAPCAVGLFPAGKNWTDTAWDLAGNVLEWCSTKWEREYEKGWQERSTRDEWSLEYLNGGKAVRVLRGGYIGGDTIYKRVTRGSCRFFFPPSVADRALGFSLRLLKARID